MGEVNGARDGLRYRLLGPVEVHGPAGPAPLGAPKQRAMLAVLLLHANQVVAEERLVDLVWGERPPPTVRGRVRVHISELRSVLGRDVISRAGDGYRIEVAPGELDLHVFLDEVTQARREQRAERPLEAAERFREALRLWRGSPLGGVSEALARQARPGLEQRRLSTLEELYEVELAAGRHALIVDELREAVAEYTFREPLAAQLMLALHRCGRRSDALAVYAEIRERLIDELGIEPGQGLREMQMRILNDADEAPAPARQMARPAPVVPAELPRDIPDFTGRADALADLDKRLLGQGGVVVISGTAGLGKTALAVHWAHQVRDRFPDGQLYINLRGYELEAEPVSPGAALSQLLRSLGVEPRQLPDTVDEQAVLYRSLLAERRVLVVLDNARDAAQVEPLIPATGSVVVTSRHRLSELVARWGAYSVGLDALADHEARELLEATLGAEQVSAEPTAAAELANLCAGLPFALRIAAARVDPRGPAPIAEVVRELAEGDRLGGLALDGAGQSAIATAFVASYRALAPDQQRMFQLLGLVPGPDFTPAAAAALAAIPHAEAVRRLNALTAAHMIEHHTAHRYRLHDLIRLFAAEQLRGDRDEGRAWDRLVEHYLSVASAINSPAGASILRLPRETDPTRQAPPPELGELSGAEVDADIPNLAAAAKQAAARGPYPEAWFLVDQTRTCMGRKGHRAAWWQVAPAILDAARRSGAGDVQALLHHSIGDLSFRAGQRNEALSHLTMAVDRAHDSGWRECEAVARNALGWVLGWTGRPAEAVVHTQKAAAMFAELGLIAGENRALNNLGGHYHLLGKLDLAEDSHLQAHALSTRVRSRLMQMSDLVWLGSIQGTRGRVAEAEENLARAGEFFRAVGSTIGMAWTRIWRGRMHCQAEQYERAHQDASQALVLAREVGGRLLEGTVLLVLADAEVGLGRYASAEEHLRLAESLIGKGDFRLQMIYGQVVQARVHSHRGAPRSAIEIASGALDSARESGYQVIEPLALYSLAEACLLDGESERAAEYAREAIALSQRMGLVHEERRVSRLLAT